MLEKTLPRTDVIWILEHVPRQDKKMKRRIEGLHDVIIVLDQKYREETILMGPRGRHDPTNRAKEIVKRESYLTKQESE